MALPALQRPFNDHFTRRRPWTEDVEHDLQTLEEFLLNLDLPSVSASPGSLMEHDVALAREHADRVSTIKGEDWNDAFAEEICRILNR